MNLLIVADKTEAKTYEAIAKTAPNTAVLGAVTRIDSDFISLLGDKRCLARYGRYSHRHEYPSRR